METMIYLGDNTWTLKSKTSKDVLKKYLNLFTRI